MNLFSSKRGQMNVEKFLTTAENLNNEYCIQNKKNKNIEENKDKKSYQESKYNLKQILKNYNLNRMNNKNGYTKEYINLFTDLLYENNHKNYSIKRLCLVDFRKKIIKNKISLSFQNFINNGSLSDRIHNKINLTSNDQKLFNLKAKNKTFSNLNTKKIKSRNFLNNKKEISSIDFLKKINIKINPEINSFSKNSKKFTLSELSNLDFSKINKTKKIKSKTIESYNCKKTENDNKYVWFNDPKEEYLEKNNRIKFIDYLSNKYDFYTNKAIHDKININEIHKRQNLFNKDFIKLNQKVDFPFKKEFFLKFNRLKFKNNNK